MTLQRIKEEVEQVLSSDTRARNDDKWLIYCFLMRYTDTPIPFDEFRKIPSFESITRARRLIQNKEGRFLPDKNVDEIRRNSEEEFKQEMRNYL